ncbi:Ornithine lipid N-methyltransferase [Sporomusa carbonis]|uniref:class I SAM-dependent methyltransferase n=1 Tax=Sporomusa carbonis TaxID=3076075 RepID=UPI003A70AE46
MMTERIVFLNKFIMEPKKIGSITPSSSFLTRKMLGKLPWNKIETIIELGAGTGVFTNYISENKKELCRVLVVEQDFKMQEALRIKYPAFYYGAKAEKLDRLLQKYDLPQVDCVVSGLPFAVFPDSVRHEIMMAVDRSLKPGGIFVAFQYSLQMRKTLKQYFSELKISFVLLNLPPAFVYYCKK